MNTNATTNAPLTVAGTIHFARRGKTKELRLGPRPVPLPAGRVPRVARLMALALKFQDLVREGAVADYAELARLGHVTRAWLTQIMNLTLLAPSIQEALLFLPVVEQGRDPVILHDLQSIAMTLNWHKQRKAWSALLATRSRPRCRWSRSRCRSIGSHQRHTEWSARRHPSGTPSARSSPHRCTYSLSLHWNCPSPHRP
jgi:hypothetical protein